MGASAPQDAITDPDFFSFYQPGMTFEQFVREFAEWFSQKRPAAMMIGIRADESFNRFVAIASLNKQRFADDKPWTTAAPGGHSWYIYPIYDWKVADIWTWYANHQQLCNPLYNIMYQAGVICEFANLLARSNDKDYGSITLSNRIAGLLCAHESAG